MGHFVIQISSYAQVDCKGKTEQCMYVCTAGLHVWLGTGRGLC